MFQVEVFWFVTTRSVVVGYQRFGGPYCLHFQDEVEAEWTSETLESYDNTTPRVQYFYHIPGYKNIRFKESH
jgi:hypothetical protein